MAQLAFLFSLILHMVLPALLATQLCLLQLHYIRTRRRRQRRARFFERQRLYLLHCVLQSNHQRSALRKRRDSQGLQARARWYALSKVSVHRRWWVYPRSRDWWDSFVMEIWDDERWVQNFRMGRSTLFDLVETLRPRIERQRTTMRKPVATEKRVAMTVWWLANVVCYRVVGHRFGVGLSTVAEIVVEVCFVMKLELLHKTVCLDDVGKVMDGFERLGFPHCIGAIDGIHIPITGPARQSEDYVNRKTFYSVLLQGATDHIGRFIDIEVGWSDHDNDAEIFRNSAVCEAMDGGLFVPGNPTVTIEGVQIPPLVVANGAYPLRRWLMTPYGGHGDSRRTLFDRHLNRAWDVVEGAFRRLKARWQCLTARLPVAETNVTAVITACVILHNICEESGHAVLGELSEPVPITAPQPTEPCLANDNSHRIAGECVREAVATYLLTHEAATSTPES